MLDKGDKRALILLKKMSMLKPVKTLAKLNM